MTGLALTNLGRLVKVCGMLGSAHDGERTATAMQADRIVRNAGLTWPLLLGVKTAPTGSALDQKTAWSRELSPATILTDYGQELTAWNIWFLSNLEKRAPASWSPRQREILAGIRGRIA